MKFDVTYNNGNACPDFIRYISQSLISINVKSKLKRVNFITVLCDGAKDAAIIEKECVFVLFVDPDNFTPSMICLFVFLASDGTNVNNGLKSGLITQFQESGLH